VSEPILLNLDEAAALLGLDRSSLHNLARPRSSRNPRSIKLGKKLMFRRAELEEWVAEWKAQ
jgi:excisionase family DNA binding protein